MRSALQIAHRFQLFNLELIQLTASASTPSSWQPEPLVAWNPSYGPSLNEAVIERVDQHAASDILGHGQAQQIQDGRKDVVDMGRGEGGPLFERTSKEQHRSRRPVTMLRIHRMDEGRRVTMVRNHEHCRLLVDQLLFGRNKTGRARLQLQKDRIGFVSEHSIGSKRDIAAVVAVSMDGRVEIRLEPPADPEKWKPTRLMELVSEAIETTQGMTTNQILSLVNGRREYKIQAISNLVAERYVRTEPGPRNALLHHSEKPYREPQP